MLPPFTTRTEAAGLTVTAPTVTSDLTPVTVDDRVESVATVEVDEFGHSLKEE